jgi:hypothetical protein
MIEVLQEHGGILGYAMGLVIVFWIVLKLLQHAVGGMGKLSWMKLLGQGAGARSSGEPDPLAEAEVYLSFGRKEQAIEILEAAIKTHPARRQEFENRIRELRGQPQPVNPVTKL